MKVFYTDNWQEIEKKLKKRGKTIFIDNSSKIKVKINDVTLEADLRDVLEFLANLGYDFVGLSKPDLNVKKIQDLDEVLNLEDFVTLNSLIKSMKAKEGSKECGAIGIFVGFVREISNDKQVVKLEYEKFDELFSKKLKEIENKLKSYEGVVDVKIHHKTGVLLPGEDIIYVVIMGKHRKDIWEPLEQSMEIVKKELPIWKKEVYLNGEIWVHDKDV